MRGVLVGVIILIILGALGYFFVMSDQYKTEKPAAKTSKEINNQASPSASDSGKKSSNVSTISYTSSGFTPQSTTIKSGDSVTWSNDSASNVQIGSDNHPTHTINQEITGDQFVIELAKGESETVQLNKTGEWGYHNHLQPAETGTIIVE